jgi:hypothetical protein
MAFNQYEFLQIIQINIIFNQNSRWVLVGLSWPSSRPKFRQTRLYPAYLDAFFDWEHRKGCLEGSPLHGLQLQST